ncbi:MAG: DNA replication/repair protein RecF [Gammaproteobacteria bacterium]
MALRRLAIDNLRCLERVEIEPAGGLNFLTGPNASGKTSLLEAIFFLGRGRTFRGGRREAAIRESAEMLRVVGHLVEGEVIGVEIRQGEWVARAAGKSVESLADLARLLPVQLVDPEIHRLVQEGPGERRRYLDWAAFHVKPQFLHVWRDYQRALRQRNAALKAGTPDSGLRVWDRHLAAAGGALDELRAEVLALLAAPVQEASAALLGEAVELEYRPGHAGRVSLGAALEAGRDRDRRLGTTQAGPHRADINVTFESHKARGWVSRGQQKLVAAALVLGQARLLAPLWDGRGVLLVDDPAAELDGQRLAAMLAYVRTLPFQVFLTGLDQRVLDAVEPDRVFHVEQGQVAQVV